MRVCSIASGSNGNCIYAGSDDTHILIDCGISGKRVEKGLNEIGLTAKDINGMLITHEHSDHIQGLGVLARRHGIPMYMTEGTLRYVNRCSSLGKIPEGLIKVIKADHDFSIGDVQVQPFTISHDANEPVGYRVSTDNKSMAVATDMGVFDEYIIGHLLNLDMILLEANHDVRMLEAGPYPYQLKQRILSDHGHLSNETAGHLLNEILHDDMKHIILGHLSGENNYPALAYETVCSEITMSDSKYKASDFHITVARRDASGELIEW